MIVFIFELYMSTVIMALHFPHCTVGSSSTYPRTNLESETLTIKTLRVVLGVIN